MVRIGSYDHFHVHKNLHQNHHLGGGNSNIFYVQPLFGEDEPILTNIFQMG